jgi:hypothetical protein
MNRLTVLTDIAGRVSIDTVGSARVTAAAIAVGTSDTSLLRSLIPPNMPKWQACRPSDAERAIELIASYAVSVGVMSINKDTATWLKFAEDGKILQDAIVLQSRRVAGWAKPSNLLAFHLLGGAYAIALGHGIRVGPRPHIVDSQGLQLIECSLICDTDISGDENLEVFKSFWDEQHRPHSQLAQYGVRVSHEEVHVTTEQLEPLLLLADYAAGISHAALLPAPGRLPLPLTYDQANVLLERLRDGGKLVVESLDFDISYEAIFGPVMKAAREQKYG